MTALDWSLWVKDASIWPSIISAEVQELAGIVYCRGRESSEQHKVSALHTLRLNHHLNSLSAHPWHAATSIQACVSIFQ